MGPSAPAWGSRPECWRKTRDVASHASAGGGDAVVAELIGWFGASLSCVISLPQVVRTMRAKRLDGISSATYVLVLANAAAWTAWSLLTGEYAAGVPALVNGPVAIVILHRLVATRHTASRNKFDTAVRASPHA